MREGSVPANTFGKVDKVKTNPPVRSPDLIEPVGPTDPTVSILALREPGGRSNAWSMTAPAPIPISAWNERGLPARERSI